MLVFAACYLVFYSVLSERANTTFLIIIGIAALVLFVPWERLTSLKVGEIELTLDQPQIKGAIDSLVDVDNKKIRETIEKKADLIAQVKNSKILWIDHDQYRLIGEKRLFRALGANIISATSSKQAAEILRIDGDFDLIITNAHRKYDKDYPLAGDPVFDGTNFIVKLRKWEKSEAISKIPVIFYACYDLPRLVKFTESARKTNPKPRICNKPEILLDSALKILSKARSNPIKVSVNKEPAELDSKLQDDESQSSLVL